MHFKVFSGLVLLLSFFTSVISAPIDSRGLISLVSKDVLKAALDFPKDQSLFFSGPGGYGDKALDWTFNQASQFKVLDTAWTDGHKLFDEFVDGPLEDEFFDVASELMAEMSSGVVHVMLPSDTKGLVWDETTVWARKEWPNLSKDVTKVIRINPDNDDQEVIFQR